MKVLILGGNAAGMSAAGRLRRKAPDTEVIVIEKSGEVSYGACGLPYFVGGVNDDLDLMRIRKAEQFRSQGIDLRLHESAVRIDYERHCVQISRADTQYEETYDKLLIATGSTPMRPGVLGTDLKNVFVLKTLKDGEKVKAAVCNPAMDVVAIIGGGYIGLELAEACLRQKKRVLLIEALPHLLNGFSETFGEAARDELVAHGVQVHTGEAVTGLAQTETGGLRITTAGGAYEADAVVVAAGVRPNTAFLGETGPECLRNGAVITNLAMETSVPDVYAAGDCATVVHRILQTPAYLPLGTNANKQGRFAADSILGKVNGAYGGALGTAMLRCVTLELAKTGITEKEAASAGMNAASILVSAPSHAPYYTDPAPVEVKILLTFERESGRILGAEVMGRGESAIRIDVFASAITAGMTVGEIGAMDLGYAPPFASVWDAIQIAANAAKV